MLSHKEDGRAPQGARGLKFPAAGRSFCDRRAPQGARGLKFLVGSRASLNRDKSCPARGTWIEIRTTFGTYDAASVVPRKGHVD